MKQLTNVTRKIHIFREIRDFASWNKSRGASEASEKLSSRNLNALHHTNFVVFCMPITIDMIYVCVFLPYRLHPVKFYSYLS